MIRAAALLPIVLALSAVILARHAGAQGQGVRQEGPTEIEKCQTISQPGSYKLVNNLTAPAGGNDCLVTTADFVTIDLAGFTISSGATAILAAPPSGRLQGIAVRNGSIFGFFKGVDLGSADGSIVEGLRVLGIAGPPGDFGINANGIVKGNTVARISHGAGIRASGIISGNYIDDNEEGIIASAGSTVIGNTATGNVIGIEVDCPSNVTNNTTDRNLVLQGTGCTNTNNVAP